LLQDSSALRWSRSQSILLDIYTPEERGSAMALFGVSVMVDWCWVR
jgi:hypothetical protein